MVFRSRDKQNFGNAQCQNCYKHGHWTYQCKDAKVYLTRPTKSQILRNPKLAPKLLSDDEIPEVPRVTDGDFYRDEHLWKQRQAKRKLYYDALGHKNKKSSETLSCLKDPKKKYQKRKVPSSLVTADSSSFTSSESSEAEDDSASSSGSDSETEGSSASSSSDDRKSNGSSTSSSSSTSSRSNSTSIERGKDRKYASHRRDRRRSTVSHEAPSKSRHIRYKARVTEDSRQFAKAGRKSNRGAGVKGTRGDAYRSRSRSSQGSSYSAENSSNGSVTDSSSEQSSKRRQTSRSRI